MTGWLNGRVVLRTAPQESHFELNCVWEVNLRQEGTWDPWLQCLPLETHLLQQQKTRRLQGWETASCVAGTNDRQQDVSAPKPSYFWGKSRSKSRVLCVPPALNATKGVGRPPRTCLQPDAGPIPTSSPSPSLSSHTSGSKLGCLLFSLPPTRCSRGPHRALPEFLVCPLINFYWLR